MPSKTIEPNMCLVCHKKEIEFCGLCCSEPSLCKGCAMKQATGGRCRVCSVFFGELKRVVRNTNADDDEHQAQE